MFTEDQFIPLSSLQHYVFCPRQCALIHVEDVWSDNLFTVRGRILHEKVDKDTYETRGTLRTVRGLRIHSVRLGLTGRCDVVEFINEGSKAETPEAVPVEFKAGQPKHNISDEVQLCAQALCLEEMLGVPVRRGWFFYGRIRRRVQVEIHDTLRRQTEEIIEAVHDLVETKRVPRSPYEKKCTSCSLLDICQPKAMNERRLGWYMKELYG